MKKVFILSVAVFLLFIFIGVPMALARTETPLPLSASGGQGGTQPVDGGGSGKLDNPLGRDFETIVRDAITFVLGLTGVLALIAFVWGGFEWMTSMGVEAKVKKGKDMMIWAVWGLFIIFGSYAILTFIFGALGFAAGG